MLYSFQELSGVSNQSLVTSISDLFVNDCQIAAQLSAEATTVDMSLSTLYLHELHQRQIQKRGYRDRSTGFIRPNNPIELATLSELGQEQAPLLLHQDSSRRLNINS